MHVDAFQVIADPARRQILEVLSRGEMPVNDVVGKLDIHQSGVSRHLRILSEAGFVRMRPEGQRRLYSLRQEPFRELETWLAQYHRLWEARLDRFGQALEERQRARATGSKQQANTKGTRKK